MKTPKFGHVSGDFESEFKVGTLNPKTFEPGEFCRVNGFLLNRLSIPDIFPPAFLWVCGKTKMEDLAGGLRLPNLVAVSGDKFYYV